jgi:hypothetical protein
MYLFVLFDSQVKDHAIGGEERGGVSIVVQSGGKVSVSASVAKDD